VTPVTAYIGLGANLGDPAATLRAALSELAAQPGIGDCTASPFYRTVPIDTDGPLFINAVARIHTTLAALALLDVLQAIENAHHRERPYRYAPRTLDLDLLLMDGIEMHTERLTVPHPRTHQRAFVLRPLQDLAPDLVLAQGSLTALLAACADQALQRLDAI
jgi:2-amino-4-hydroxy-6-hydroxymethyldihydropteridine diphosphokinase